MEEEVKPINITEPTASQIHQVTETVQEFVPFCETMLGIPISKHPGQIKFAQLSTHLINILRPGNQWGKTCYLAMRHLWHAIAKPKLKGLNPNLSWEEWQGAEYLTLNAGKNYEMARAVYHTMLQIAQGRFLFPNGTTNECQISHLITHTSEQPMPEIRWATGVRTLFRSYDDMGASFKMQRLAYASVDEVGDIPHLIEFLNATLLPRIVRMDGTIDLVGTPQDPAEYLELIEKADRGEGDYYVQEGSMYENPFLSRDAIMRIEETADPELRKRIIYGQFVDYGDKYFSFNEVSNMFDEQMEYQRNNSLWDHLKVWTEEPSGAGRYIISYDPASGDKNYSVIMIIRYDRYPYKLVYEERFKGSKYPMSSQYQLVRDTFWKWKRSSAKTDLIFDSGGPSGKNARDYLDELQGFPFPGKRMYSDVKAEALGRTKTVMGKNRMLDENGRDVNPRWGGLKCPPIRELRLEVEGYRLDDTKITQDQVMTMAMALWYIELRRPSGVRKKAVDFDLFGM